MAAKPRVFVTHPLRLAGGAELPLAPLLRAADCDVWEGSGAPPPAELRRRARECEGLLCMLTDRVDASLAEACPRLRVVSSCSVGVDHIDLRAMSERGISVGHTPGVLAETTADLAFALMLASARRIVEADRFIRNGGWSQQLRWEPDMLLGRDLHGATLGVVGLGAIGQAVARRGLGFGMRVLSWTPSGRSAERVEATDLEALLEQSDFVSIHVALSEQTRGLIDERAFARMKPGAVLVNSARGGIVDEAALVGALQAGRLGGAALDVFAHEPLPPDDPLLHAPNVVLTPHIGSASVLTRYRMAELSVANLLAGLEGRPLPHRANP
jgi:glyoxylate reductase